MIRSITSTASPRLRPGVFLAASRPVVEPGTPAAARTDCESRTTRSGLRCVRPARAAACAAGRESACRKVENTTDHFRARSRGAAGFAPCGGAVTREACEAPPPTVPAGSSIGWGGRLPSSPAQQPGPADHRRGQLLPGRAHQPLHQGRSPPRPRTARPTATPSTTSPTGPRTFQDTAARRSGFPREWRRFRRSGGIAAVR